MSVRAHGDDAVLGTLLARAAERFGDRPYLSFALDDRDVTFAEAADAAARVAGGLAGLGVAPGDRVLLMLRNRVEFVLGWLGAATLGAAQVPVNVDYRGAFLEHLAATAGARVIVVETDLLDAVEAALPRLPALQTVVVVGDVRGSRRAGRPVRGAPRRRPAGAACRDARPTRRPSTSRRARPASPRARSSRTARCTCSAAATASSSGSGRTAST